MLLTAEKGVFAFQNCVRKECQRPKVQTSQFSSLHRHLSKYGYDYVFGLVVNLITVSLLLLCGGSIVQQK